MAPPAPRASSPQAPASLPTLTDELLEEIFLHLPTVADVARASASCASFRRVITDRSFLRRFRAVHPPPLLGLVAYEGFLPAEPPLPSAPLARALADAADFSYSFVPIGRWGTPWHPRNVRQGRVLLDCTPTPECGRAFEYYDIVYLRDLELAVCDPLSRRYRLLPRIPKQLRAQHRALVDSGLFLAPIGHDDDGTAFRVVCVACNKTMLVVFEFTSITGKWHVHAHLSCGSLGTIMPYSRYTSSFHDYEHGCFYWTMPWGNNLLVLDVLRMNLSIVKSNLAGYRDCDSGMPLIVADRDGTPEVYFLANWFGDGPTDLIHIIKENEAGSSDEWKLENMISLPTQYNFFTLGAAGGFLFLRGMLQDQDSGSSSEESSDNPVHLLAEPPDVEYFSVDLKTSELKKVCGMKQYFHSAYAYFGYPPPLAKSVI